MKVLSESPAVPTLVDGPVSFPTREDAQSWLENAGFTEFDGGAGLIRSIKDGRKFEGIAQLQRGAWTAYIAQMPDAAIQNFKDANER